MVDEDYTRLPKSELRNFLDETLKDFSTRAFTFLLEVEPSFLGLLEILRMKYIEDKELRG